MCVKFHMHNLKLPHTVLSSQQLAITIIIYTRISDTHTLDKYKSVKEMNDAIIQLDETVK